MGTMQERTLELNIISATQLKKVNTLGHQTSYVVAYIDPDEKHTSKVDEVGALNPTWNFKITLHCEEHLLQHHGSYLTIEIFSHGYISEKPVGTVIVPLRDIAKEPRCYIEPQLMAFEVCRPSGKAKGVLNMSVKIGSVQKRLADGNNKHLERVYPSFVCTRLNTPRVPCTCTGCR